MSSEDYDFEAIRKRNAERKQREAAERAKQNESVKESCKLRGRRGVHQ